MQKAKQMSETFTIGVVLAMAGGFMDAYSYVCRGQVFANAQTGNILLAGVHFSEGNWSLAMRYVCPVVSFAIGIALADIIKYRFKEKQLIHWRQSTVLIEAVILFGIGFIPLTMNELANSLTSLACGIQVESFRKIRGNGIATTMCIGNLRTATQAICDYWHTKDKAAAEKGLLYFGIIFLFMMGAILGNFCVQHYQEKAIMFNVIFLGAAFCMMFIDKEKQD